MSNLDGNMMIICFSVVMVLVLLWIIFFGNGSRKILSTKKDKDLQSLSHNLHLKANRFLNEEHDKLYVEQYFSDIYPWVNFYIKVEVGGEIFFLGIGNTLFHCPGGLTSEDLELLKNSNIQIKEVFPGCNFKAFEETRRLFYLNKFYFSIQ